jgi:putative PIG3 family NAD(P)H quinone oxidoreductase
VPGSEELLVRVTHAGLNPADLSQREGSYPAPPGSPQDVPGLEVSGTVEACGAQVLGWKPGDRVFGLVGGGGLADRVLVHQRCVAAVPDVLDEPGAAAVPEAFITAHDAIVGQAGLRGGETLLVHAVGSGVGTAAVQLGRALGVFVIGTARTAAKLERARELGMNAGVVVENAKFADAVRKHGEPHVVLELVGGPYFDEDIRTVGVLGRIVLVGLLAGGRNEVDLGGILRKRLRIFGTVLRARPLEEKIAVMRSFEAQIVPLLQRGLIAPVIDEVMDLDAAAAAHQRMASNAGFGKIILRC